MNIRTVPLRCRHGVKRRHTSTPMTLFHSAIVSEARNQRPNEPVEWVGLRSLLSTLAFVRSCCRWKNTELDRTGAPTPQKPGLTSTSFVLTDTTLLRIQPKSRSSPAQHVDFHRQSTLQPSLHAKCDRCHRTQSLAANAGGHAGADQTSS